MFFVGDRLWRQSQIHVGVERTRNALNTGQALFSSRAGLAWTRWPLSIALSDVIADGADAHAPARRSGPQLPAEHGPALSAAWELSASRPCDALCSAIAMLRFEALRRVACRANALVARSARVRPAGVCTVDHGDRRDRRSGAGHGWLYRRRSRACRLHRKREQRCRCNGKQSSAGRVHGMHLDHQWRLTGAGSRPHRAGRIAIAQMIARGS